MRDFKFRAWDEEEEIMSESFSLRELEFTGLCASWKNCVIMQWTGLTDNNGKDIYEGDIIKKDEIISYVVWVDGMYFFRQIGLTDEEFLKTRVNTYEEYIKFLYQDKCNFVEVIGNVFENPEMIKK